MSKKYLHFLFQKDRVLIIFTLFSYAAMLLSHDFTKFRGIQGLLDYHDDYRRLLHNLRAPSAPALLVRA